jgi:HEPN domain/Nucleotidyltransferase domain
VYDTLTSEIVRRILAVANPDRIILFGSAATGQMTRDSDIDLLIVAPTAANRHAESVKIRNAIGDVPLSHGRSSSSTRSASKPRRIFLAELHTPLTSTDVKSRDAELRDLVRDWLRKADLDWDVAARLVSEGDRFRDIVAFHCQQAVEKYVKAILVRHQVEFRKTHDSASC